MKKGSKLSIETRKKMSKARLGKVPWIKGKNHTIKTRKRISGSLKGRTAWNLGKKLSIEHRQKMSETHKGKKNPNWRGGIGSINVEIRRSLEYKLWRESVFERDNYTCVWCKKKGLYIHADHIKPFSLFPELRFAIDNGRTLCIGCHKLTDTYAGKMKTWIK